MKLTVFTPTYNRAYILLQLYNSLIEQSNKNFIWLIIDDGSTDNTQELIKQWQKENLLQIRYIYQQNQGMHGAHNTAYKNIETELNVCIDSDDYMPKNAIEKILPFWNKKGSDKYAGLVGLDIDKTGNVIGTGFPKDLETATLTDIYHKYKVKGDKKLVYRTEVIKKYPQYPIFEGEKFVPLGYLYSLIDKDYKLLVLNKPLCVVEYMEDGSTRNIFKQYANNPKGFRFSRIEKMKKPINTVELLKNTLHYISSNLFIRDKTMFKNSPRKFLTFVLFPFGVLFHYWIKKNKI